MKKYVYLLVVALLAIELQSCSSSEDDLITTPDDETIAGNQRGQNRGNDKDKPVEGQMFYVETTHEVEMISAVGTFSTINSKGEVEVYDNLGGGLQTKEGASFYVTNRGKGLYIIGSGTYSPMSGYIYDTWISLYIDDASLIEKGEATITTLNLTTDVTYTVAGETETVYHRLAAANIPMVTATPTFNHWSGGVVTDYLWLSGDSSMKLYDGPTNIMNVWITFKNGIKAQARIAR